jgi:flagellar biosynthetic protein FliR
VRPLEGQLTSFLLAGTRFAPVLVFPALTPFAWAPVFVRAALLAALSGLAAASAPAAPPVAFEEPVQFCAALAGEASLGMVFGAAVMLPMAAAGFAARVVDIQAGFSADVLFDPTRRMSESLIGNLVQWLMMLVFFATGLHVLLLEGLLASLRLAPLGALPPGFGHGSVLMLLSGQFLLGVALVAPVIVGLLIMDVALAFASRSMPQANIYFVALPIKGLAALLLLAATLRFAPPWVEQAFRHSFSAISPGIGV